MNHVKIFTKSTCGFCRQAKEFLDDKGIPYEEVDASTEDGRDQLSQLGFHVVPVLIINEQTIRVALMKFRFEKLWVFDDSQSLF